MKKFKIDLNKKVTNTFQIKNTLESVQGQSRGKKVKVTKSRSQSHDLTLEKKNVKSQILPNTTKGRI